MWIIYCIYFEVKNQNVLSTGQISLFFLSHLWIRCEHTVSSPSNTLLCILYNPPPQKKTTKIILHHTTFTRCADNVLLFGLCFWNLYLMDMLSLQFFPLFENYMTPTNKIKINPRDNESWIPMDARKGANFAQPWWPRKILSSSPVVTRSAPAQIAKTVKSAEATRGRQVTSFARSRDAKDTTDEEGAPDLPRTQDRTQGARLARCHTAGLHSTAQKHTGQSASRKLKGLGRWRGLGYPPPHTHAQTTPPPTTI